MKKKLKMICKEVRYSNKPFKIIDIIQVDLHVYMHAKLQVASSCWEKSWRLCWISAKRFASLISLQCKFVPVDSFKCCFLRRSKISFFAAKVDSLEINSGGGTSSLLLTVRKNSLDCWYTVSPKKTGIPSFWEPAGSCPCRDHGRVYGYRLFTLSTKSIQLSSVTIT